MTSLVEQTARFLSGNRPLDQEKSLSDAEIEDLLNKSSGSLAYTIVDVDKEISNDVLGKISDIDGILRLRYLGI